MTSRRRASLVLALGLPVLLGLTPTSAPDDALPDETSSEDADPEVAEQLEDAREDAEDAREDLDAMAERVDELEVAIVGQADELARLDESEGRWGLRIDDLESELEVQARQMYMAGAPDPLSLIVSSEDAAASLRRASVMAAAARSETVAIEELAVAIDSLETLRARVRAEQDELEDMRSELEEATTELADALADAEAEVDRLELKARRQVPVSRGDQQGVYACPLGDPLTFRDTWGDPRSGGRSHKGVDMFAPMDTPMYAIHDGVVTRMKGGGLGGIAMYLQGDDGVLYYYAHLAGYADGISVGTRVKVGDLIAYNGDTGNARGGPPHLHFQVHPGAGAPVNPTPWVSAPCDND